MTDPPVAKRVSGGALATAILVVALWGGNTVAVSFSVDALPPVAVGAMRFAMASAVMLIWCLAEKTPLRATRHEFWIFLVAAFLLFTQIATFNVGVVMTNSTHGVMLINTFVFWVAGIEHFLTRTHQLNRQRALGLTVAALGVVLVMMAKDQGGSGPATADQSFLMGDLILLASAVLLAIRIVYVRHVVQDIAPSKLIFWHDVFSVLMFATWSLLTETYSDMEFTRPAILGLLYQGVIVAGICFILQAYLLRQYRASQVSVFSFATPVFGVFFSVSLRGEPLTALIAVSAVLVACGIWLVNRESPV